MQGKTKNSLEENNDNMENVLTQGKVIKIVEELEFGVIETEESDFLFFHISNFDNDIDISEIKEGDLILCNRETQKSDGRQAAINCQRVEFRGYLKDYFIENALVAPSDVALFDEFCENSREYAGYLVEAIDVSELEDLRDKALAAENVADLKELRPELEEKKIEYEDNKIFNEFIEIMDEIIKKIKADEEDNMELENFKSFIQILMSYTQFL